MMLHQQYWCKNLKCISNYYWGHAWPVWGEPELTGVSILSLVPRPLRRPGHETSLFSLPCHVCQQLIATGCSLARQLHICLYYTVLVNYLGCRLAAPCAVELTMIDDECPPLQPYFLWFTLGSVFMPRCSLEPLC